MAITILRDTAQTRETVIRAFQEGSTPIGWVLRHSAGYVFNPDGSPNQFGLVGNVQDNSRSESAEIQS